MEVSKNLNVDRLTDDSLMPRGKYKGTPMRDVPASHLKYLWDMDYAWGDVKEYIKENLDAITKEVKKQWE